MRHVALMAAVCVLTAARPAVAESTAVGGTVYYVSPAGNDAADGRTAITPWKSFQRAQGVLRPGDTLLVRGGTYSNVSFFPSYAGTEAKPITITAYPGEKPVITGNPTWGFLIGLFRDWYVLDGFHFDNINGAAVVVNVLDAKHIVVRNNVFGRNTGDTHLRVFNAGHVVIEKNRFDTTGSLADGGNGDNIYVGGSTHVLIRNNYFTRAGHAAIDFIDYNGLLSAYNVVRDNVIEQHWGGGVYVIRGSHHTVIERNRIAYVGEQISYPKTGIQIAAEDNIVRHNIITNASASPMANCGMGLNAYTFNGIVQNSRRNRIYNNVVHKAGGCAVYAFVADTAALEDNVVANNVFYGNRIAGSRTPNLPEGMYYVGIDLSHSTKRSGVFPGTNRFLNNVIMHADAGGDRPGERLVLYEGYWQKTLAEVQSTHPGAFAGNLEKNPRFVAADAADYSLSTSSPAVDAGAHLARTVSAGNATTVVPVNDVSFFSDGFGLVQGDSVIVGANSPAVITQVDRDRQTLTVDRALSFAAGDFVDLPFHGSAPDPGAFEAAAESAPPRAPGAAVFTPIRLNAGGARVLDASGLAWAGDTNSAGYAYNSGQPIGNTANSSLYQSQRWSTAPLEYRFAVPPGTYSVTLKFAEMILFPGPGMRKFDIAINGRTVESAFDAAAAAGGWLRAVDRRYAVTADAGQIAIHLAPVVNGPIINAIEIAAAGAATEQPPPVVEPPPPAAFTPIRVNAGGLAVTGAGGLAWARDTSASGYAYNSGQVIANTSNSVVYQSQRWSTGPLAYEFAVPGGTYTVTLKFAEMIYYPGPGMRKFDVAINGNLVDAALDVAASAGGWLRALDRQYRVDATAGKIAIHLAPVLNGPIVNGIEISPAL